MDSGRRLRAGRTYPHVTTHGGHEQHSGVGVHLFDLDVGQMREQLLDGVTRPDNDSSSGVHHTVRARAENGSQMFVTSGAISPLRPPMN
jgi:hypothetical protein